jgi:large subunit ribosomal protein L18
MKKIEARNRRARKLRSLSEDLNVNRLAIFRSAKNIYAQVFSVDGKQILAQASSLDKELKASNGGNVEAAEKVGELVAKRAIEQGIKKVTFDRSGYKFHGRVKSLAEGARSQGLEF